MRRLTDRFAFRRNDDALMKDRLDQELDSLVPTADGPGFAATLEGLLAKSRTRFEGRGAMHRRVTS
jgi:hypothetical protein